MLREFTYEVLQTSMIERRPKHGEVAQVRFAQEGQVQSAWTKHGRHATRP